MPFFQRALVTVIGFLIFLLKIQISRFLDLVRMNGSRQLQNIHHLLSVVMLIILIELQQLVLISEQTLILAMR